MRYTTRKKSLSSLLTHPHGKWTNSYMIVSMAKWSMQKMCNSYSFFLPPSRTSFRNDIYTYGVRRSSVMNIPPRMGTFITSHTRIRHWCIHLIWYTLYGNTRSSYDSSDTSRIRNTSWFTFSAKFCINTIRSRHLSKYRNSCKRSFFLSLGTL